MKTREMTFRGRRKDGSLVYGSLLQNFGGCVIVPDCQMEGRTGYVVDADSVEMSTLMGDCQGREIFEGDEVVDPQLGTRSLVAWDEGRFVLRSEQHSDWLLYTMDWRRCYVVTKVEAPRGKAADTAALVAAAPSGTEEMSNE